jgi:hypothetical protein
MRRLLLLMMTLAVLLMAGCNAAPGLRPQTAVTMAMGNPEVAAWYREHSIPRIVGGPGGTDEKRWRHYRPAVTVDRVPEGLVVRLHARLGPQPRNLEVLMESPTGRLMTITKK